MLLGDKTLWAYGITTYPGRVDTLLPETIASLSQAGFPEPILFVDGYIPPDKFAPLRTVNWYKVGPLRSWSLALSYLYTTQPHADRYAIFEDDCIACPNLRAYLEKTEYAAKTYYNLITHTANLVLCGPEHGWFPTNQKGLGAVGLVFDQKTVQELLTSHGFNLRPTMRNESTDGMVIDSLKPLGYTEFAHYPSLLQHTGLKSSLGHRYGPMKSWKEGYDPLTEASK